MLRNFPKHRWVPSCPPSGVVLATQPYLVFNSFSTPFLSLIRSLTVG
jgi:hypothetical protein